MQRWDIINYFIRKNDYKSYLEIGYYKGWSFDQVKCQNKWAVDPNPSKTSEQEAWSYGTTGIINKMTSDEYFSVQRDDPKYDIIFIDGLHESEQLQRDIENSLKHLSSGGTIVLHDMNPPQYKHTTTGIDGCWTGDCYKVGIRLTKDYHLNGFKFYVIDTDWGVGILQPQDIFGDIMVEPDYDKALQDWDYFNENRQQLLNIVSVEEFKRRENINDATKNLTEKLQS